jgi:hypothetical protein
MAKPSDVNDIKALLAKRGEINANAAGINTQRIPNVEDSSDAAPVRSQPLAGLEVPVSGRDNPPTIDIATAIKAGYDPVLNPVLGNHSVADRLQMGKVTICSIYPRAFTSQLLLSATGGGGFTTYSIPAAPRGSYALLDVYDAFSLQRDLTETEGERHVPRIKTAIQIATDLVSLWAENTLGAGSGGGAGVTILAGSTPTDQELSNLNAHQLRFADYMIQQGNDFYQARKLTEIRAVHRDMLYWKFGDRPKGYPWYVSSTVANTKPCIACREDMDMEALVCATCRTNLVQFYLDLGILPPADDPTVRAKVQQISAARGIPIVDTEAATAVS